MREVRSNPFWFRAAARPGAPMRRRMARLMPVAALGAFVVFGLAMSLPSDRVGGVLLQVYLPLRFFLLYRAAQLAVRASRRDLRAGNLPHLALAPMSGRDLAAGWAIAGWSAALPETLAAAAALAPMIALAGVAASGIALVEFAHLLTLQALSTLVASGLIAGFRHRHEAATAGWLSSAVSFPLVFAAQSLLMGLILLVLPLAAVMLLGASAPFGWMEIDAADFIVCAGALLLGVYALWMPLATLKEIDRQLDLAGEASGDGLRLYLSSEGF